MTFLSGERLWLLIAPVILLVAYLVAQRARQKAVVRFTDVALLSAVAPTRTGWQRHIGAGLLLLTLVLLTVGFARPAATTRTPQKSATVILARDTSASMAADDVAPTRLTAAKAEAAAFVRGLPTGLKVGLVSFDSTARMLVSATADRPAVLAAIAGLRPGGGTAPPDRNASPLAAIRALPKGANGKPQPAAIV